MSDLARKTGSGFDLLRNPSALFDLVPGDECEDCCDSPCVCFDGPGGDRPLFKEPYNPDYPNGSTTGFHGDCKCMDADYDDPAQDAPPVTLTVTGNGTPSPPRNRRGLILSCPPNMYGCTWDGNFAVDCGESNQTWWRFEYLCDVYADPFFGPFLDFGLPRTTNPTAVIRCYYMLKAVITYGSRAVPNVNIERAHDQASIRLISGCAFAYDDDPRDTGPQGYLPSTWSNTANTDYFFSESNFISYVDWAFAGTVFYAMYAWQEGTCPAVTCQPDGEIPSCTQAWDSSFTEYVPTGEQGCHPDPDNVTVIAV